MKSIGALIVSLCAVIGVSSAHAQDADLEEMQRSIEMFSGVLREGLDLNARAGIFSPFNGSVQGDYYMRQGVVLEIVSPLASSRSAFSWQSFESKLQQLSGQISNLVNTPRVSPPDFEAMRQTMALSLRSSGAQDAYNNFMATIRNTDFTKETEEALARASESARSLHELGKIDDARLNAIMVRVNELRNEANARVSAMTQLREEAESTQQPADINTLFQSFEQRWAETVAAMQPLRDAALEQAAQLSAQVEQAQQEREQQWQQELQSFEQKLFVLVCDYGAALRALPSDEHLTLVLKGLGAENENRREDRIHVLDKTQLQGCLQGDQEPSALQNSALTYSF